MSKYLVSDSELIEWEKALRSSDSKADNGFREWCADNIDDLRKNYHPDRDTEIDKLKQECFTLKESLRDALFRLKMANDNKHGLVPAEIMAMRMDKITDDEFIKECLEEFNLFKEENEEN